MTRGGKKGEIVGSHKEGEDDEDCEIGTRGGEDKIVLGCKDIGSISGTRSGSNFENNGSP